MRTFITVLSVIGMLGAVGCSHSLERATADYHHQRAERAAEHGRYDKAASQERKAQRDEERAVNAPLP